MGGRRGSVCASDGAGRQSESHWSRCVASAPTLLSTRAHIGTHLCAVHAGLSDGVHEDVVGHVHVEQSLRSLHLIYSAQSEGWVSCRRPGGGRRPLYRSRTSRVRSLWRAQLPTGRIEWVAASTIRWGAGSVEEVWRRRPEGVTIVNAQRRYGGNRPKYRTPKGKRTTRSPPAWGAPD